MKRTVTQYDLDAPAESTDRHAIVFALIAVVAMTGALVGMLIGLARSF